MKQDIFVHWLSKQLTEEKSLISLVFIQFVKRLLLTPFGNGKLGPILDNLISWDKSYKSFFLCNLQMG